jgi:hypothetical protein
MEARRLPWNSARRANRRTTLRIARWSGTFFTALGADGHCCHREQDEDAERDFIHGCGSRFVLRLIRLRINPRPRLLDNELTVLGDFEFDLHRKVLVVKRYAVQTRKLRVDRAKMLPQLLDLVSR